MLISCFSWDFYRIRITSDLSSTKNTHKRNFFYFDFISYINALVRFSFSCVLFVSFSFSVDLKIRFSIRFVLQIFRSGYLYANSFDSIRFNICLLSKQSIKLFDSSSNLVSLVLVFPPFAAAQIKLGIWLREKNFLTPRRSLSLLVPLMACPSQSTSLWKFWVSDWQSQSVSLVKIVNSSIPVAKLFRAKIKHTIENNFRSLFRAAAEREFVDFAVW